MLDLSNSSLSRFVIVGTDDIPISTILLLSSVHISTCSVIPMVWSPIPMVTGICQTSTCQIPYADKPISLHTVNISESFSASAK